MELRAGGRGHKSPGMNLEQMVALPWTLDTSVISSTPVPHTALPSLSPDMDSDFFPQKLGRHLAPGRSWGLGEQADGRAHAGAGPQIHEGLWYHLSQHPLHRCRD